MYNIAWVEWIGYCGSITIVMSLLMSCVTKLRVINSIGCLLFVVYGLIVKAYPVAISNLIIIFINVYHLYKIYNQKKKDQIVYQNS